MNHCEPTAHAQEQTMKANFNPMNSKPINLSAGVHVPTKAKHQMGAGKQMGPSIAKGYLVSGTGTTTPTGGPFKRANRAPKKG